MKGNVNIKEFPLLCCFCLVKSNKLTLISGMSSVNLFTLITGIKLDDSLPSNICNVCQELLENFSSFIEKSKQNIIYLKSLLNYSLGDDNYNKNTRKEGPGREEVECEPKKKSGSKEVKRNKKNLVHWFCEHCNRQFPSKKKLIKHESSHSCKPNSQEIINEEIYGESENQDSQSNDAFSEKQELQETHSKEKTPQQEVEQTKQFDFSCEKCCKKVLNQTELRHHQNVCFEIYTREVENNDGKIEKQNLENICIDNKEKYCSNCKISFLTQGELDKHMRESSGCVSSQFSCVQCNKLFNKKHKLVSHMRSHTKEEPFECEECGRGFRFQQNLKRHTLIHKGVKPFICEVCGKAFSRAHVRNEHMNTHTGNNPYICMYCGKGFKRYANHFIHVYRHKLINGEIDKTKDRKLYLQLECNECNKVFANRGALANHMLLHQVPIEKKFLCNECGKGFLTKAHLKSHSRTHTGECPYECAKCGKRYKQKSSYKSHQLTHSGEKPYRCKICAKLFTQSGHLKVHMRVHSGEKPFSCNFCDKSFSLKSNLKVHTRIHTGETPYMCAECGQGYYDSTSLKKHMKSQHRGIPSHGYLTEHKTANEKSLERAFTNPDEISIKNECSDAV